MPQGSIRLLDQKLCCLQPPQLAKESRSVPGAHRWDVLLTRDCTRYVIIATIILPFRLHIASDSLCRSSPALRSRVPGLRCIKKAIEGCRQSEQKLSAPCSIWLPFLCAPKHSAAAACMARASQMVRSQHPETCLYLPLQTICQSLDSAEWEDPEAVCYFPWRRQHASQP